MFKIGSQKVKCDSSAGYKSEQRGFICFTVELKYTEKS